LTTPYLIAHDLETTAMRVVKESGLASLVVVEQSPDWPGELIFQPANAQGFYDHYGDWTSRYLVLNQLFALEQFHRLITADGLRPIFHPNTLPILDKFDRWAQPLKVEGFSCPGDGELYPFQDFTLNRALERANNKTPADRLFFCNWTTGSGKSLFAMAGAQELFNRDQIDLVMAFTLMGSKLNLATDAVASFANTTELVPFVNDGSKAQRIRGYGRDFQVLVSNYEKCWVDHDEIRELTKGRRVLWIFDEASKVLKAHGERTRTRKALQKLVRGSTATVWPMSASVVDASPLRYRDVYNLSGTADDRNPLGTKMEFQARYSRFGQWGAGSDTDEWNRARLHEIRHRVADRTQAVRKTDPGVREYFKGMQSVIVPIHMSPQDRGLYEMIRTDARELIDATPAGESPGLQIMGHYRMLRYVCNTPEALTVSSDEFAARLREEVPDSLTSAHCAKLEQFLDQVCEIRDQGDKVVAFMHFTNLGLLLLPPHLDKRGINYVLHYGVGQTAQARQIAQQQFKTNPDVTLFLSSDAGSHGLNLPEARYVINYDVPRSYDLLMQRSERINRADSKLDGMTSYCYVTTFAEPEVCVEQEIWEENERRRLIAAATMGTVESRDYGTPRTEEQAALSIFGVAS
jgi:hypothetical protein